MRTHISVTILLFLFFFMLYSLTMTGRVRFGDEGERYLTAQSLVDRHDLAIRIQPDLHRKIGVDGRNYSSYELGSILPLVPFYAASRLGASIFAPGDPSGVEMLVTGLFNPVITALTVAILFEFALALGFSSGVSVALALLFGLGTIAFPYSKAYEREALLAFSLLLAVYALHRHRRTGRRLWFWTASGAVALLVFAKLANIIFVPFFLLYLVVPFLTSRPVGEWWRAVPQLLKAWALFGIPLALLIGIQAIINQLHFGSFADMGLSGTWGNPLGYFGIANLPTGLSGMLFSPTKSIFLYSPPVLLAILSIIPFFKQFKFEALLVLALALVTLIFNAMNSNWDQSSWWGPKYLVFLTPLILVPAGTFLERATTRRSWMVCAWLAGLAGLAVQVVAVLVDDREYLDVTGRGVDLAGAFDFLQHGAITSLVLYLSPSGTSLSLNPFAILNLLIILLLAFLLARTVITGVPPKDARPSRPTPLSFILDPSFLILLLVLLIELGAFVAWVVAPYPQVLTAQGDTRFAAADRFLADRRPLEASALYVAALRYGTTRQSEAVAQVNALSSRSPGDSFTTDDLMFELRAPVQGAVVRDDKVTLSGQGALRIRLPAEEAASAQTDFFAVAPNTTYEISGWIKTEGIYGSGYAILALYEDNGAWNKPRQTTVTLADETAGWQPFRKTVTTLPTSRRLYISAGLWQTFGTVWVDSIEFAQLK